MTTTIIWQLPVCLVDCRCVQASHREAPVPLVLGLPQGVEKIRIEGQRPENDLYTGLQRPWKKLKKVQEKVSKPDYCYLMLTTI